MTAEELYKQVNELVKQQRWNEIIEAYTRFIEEHPNDPGLGSFYAHRAELYLRHKKNYGQTIADYTAAHKADPDNLTYLFFRGGAYFQNKDYDHAIEDFTTLINSQPHPSPSYHSKRADSYNAKGDYLNAIEDYNTAKLRNDKDPTLFTGLGDAYRKTGKLERAIENYKESIRLAPKYIEAYIGLGLTYMEEGDFDLAIESFDIALKVEPDNKIAIHNRAVALSNQVNEQERQKLEERVRETYSRLEGFGKKYREESKNMKKRKKDLTGLL